MSPLLSLHLGLTEPFDKSNPNPRLETSPNHSTITISLYLRKSLPLLCKNGFHYNSEKKGVIRHLSKLFLDNSSKERFESDFKSIGICAPREVNFDFFDKEPELNVFQLFSQVGWKPFLAIKERTYPSLIREFYSNLVFSKEGGEPVGCLMIRRKKVDLTADNIRSWIGVKKGDFRRYSSKEPISMESYSIENAAKKLGGSFNGWEPDLAFFILNHMKDTLARPTVDLSYGSLIILIARARGVIFLGEDWDTSSPSSPIQVSAEEKEESVDSDATMYFESPIHQPIKEEPTEKESDATLFSSASDKEPNQDEQQAISSHLAPKNESAHENQLEPPVSKHSPKANTCSSEPLPQPPMTPLAEIREQLKNLTIQLTSSREGIYELKMIIIEMRAQ
ncbi:hypothetical protein G2W53_010410 [Senna tora]|uniref:Uncharacterized protein n=1 Tax=Senna tora TaxID=362788 RepID=A0A834WZW3_9FABA|nr:hypothetical protein G2W53_010410 [Senna tora]